MIKIATLKIKCNNQLLEWEQDPEEIYAGNENIDSVTFDFCGLWDGYTKTAVFSRDKKEVYNILLGDSNTCLLPPEVTKTNGIIFIGVFGVKGTCRRTTAVKSFYLKEGVLIEGKPSDPTPDIYNQIISLCNEAVETANSVREDADNGVFNGKNGEDGKDGADGKPGQDGYTPQKGVDYWNDADKAEINSYIDTAINGTVAAALEGDY